MTKYLRKMGLGIFKAPEFRIAYDPVVILNGIYVTALTGSVDYAIISNENIRKCKVPALKAFWLNKKPEGVEELLQSFSGFGIQITMLEAKRKKFIESESLTDCIPQVAAECIAAMKLCGASAMRWCLSTGTKWIFGVVCHEKWAEGEYRIHTIAPMEFDLDDVSKSAHVDAVQYIFWRLLCWSIVPVSEIIETVFKTVISSGYQGTRRET
ncbi:hypothetical protein M413DRAFT_404513 [Hebeloma cylindrosporum]|uniref:Uncharacterized protein n=1 Tax=Hebeloma cylindrosporum TaxID=76867 RepID=A0A0C2X9R4_HEBCY|nr:hypothetical protein M413DRAFT_404513 [Hebeloma cylindrosporum h7]